jgi:uncharacterized membrane protein
VTITFPTKRMKTATTHPEKPTVIQWPVYAITLFVGLFVLIVAAIWIINHIFKKEPITETAWIILGATALRGLTMLLALASIQKWGGKLPYWVILGGLSGAASAQLIYPLAELVVKLVFLTGLMESTGKGLGNMTLTGWFNLLAAWVIFGIPGALFLEAAKNFRARKSASATWVWLGALLGIMLLLTIGLIIG